MTRLSFALSLAMSTSALATLPLHAQSNAARGGMITAQPIAGAAVSRNRDARDLRGTPNIPRGHLPSAGMCRIWIDGLAPGRQPRATDCATAERRRPADARIIYGPRTRFPYYARVGDCRVTEDPRRNGASRYELDCIQPRGGRYDDRRRDSHWCLDRNRDGWCDSAQGRYDPRRESDYCIDRNRDGHCDNLYGGYDPRRGGTMSLPQMISVVLLEQRRFTVEQIRWLGDERLAPRWTDANRDGVPERIAWHDAAGRLLQVWVDTSRNGRADLVELHRDGRLVEVVR